MRRLVVLLWIVIFGMLLSACGNFQTRNNDTTLAAQGVEELTPLVPVASAETGVMTDETTNLWFVELLGAPLADGGSRSTIQNEQRAFRANAAQARLRIEERFAFQELFNGFSVKVNPGDVNKLLRLPGVKAVYPVITVSIPEVQSTLEPEMMTALAMTGADVAQNELKLTGQGIRVAVMDTGIDFNHPDLGGGFGPGHRVVTGYDFVGDAFSGPASTPVPGGLPMDCNGHGTHVAGIVGASGNPESGGVRGVAPGVEFGAYRVFGCTGSTTADIMIAAMERALADRMHILNMSIGSAFMTWPQYPTAAAADRLVNRGVVVVASIGNSGANGVYSAGAPGVGNKVIGVASYDNTHVALNTFTVSPGDIDIGYASASASPEAPTSGSLPVARTGTPTTADDACNALPADSLTDQAVLIRRGACTFHTKALNAQNAGAAAVILYNNAPGRFSATVAGTPAITIPVVSISDEEGVRINDLLVKGAVTMTWTDEKGIFQNPTGNLISSFSSYGLNAELTLKPDLGGPGGLIRSTWPINFGTYATISGTSMSSPHVAGAVALLLEARPRTPAQTVRVILQNSAQPKNWSGNPGLGFLDQVHRQGAGMVQIADAILSTTRVEPAKISLGESEAGPVTSTLRIENSSSQSVTYTLSHAPALSTGGSTFSPSPSTGFASVSMPESVIVPAGGSASVNVTITANPRLPDRSQYGGYIVLTGSDGRVSRVPYAGFKGDYQSITVLNAAGCNLPLLVKIEAGAQTACSARPPIAGVSSHPGGATYTMQGDDIPFFLLHFSHQSRRLRMEVFDAKTGRSFQRVMPDDQFLPRNSTSTGFFALAWDGMTVRANGKPASVVPNGNYVVKISVLKALGDESNPAHWETWTSPVITVARP
jgi:minor extracellular serine protease Vpr